MNHIAQEHLLEMKRRGTKIVVLTAYDASLASHLETAGVDVILVGDSLGMVVQGHDTTLPVSMDDMIYHTKNVARARKRALLVADMPYQSYRDEQEALANALRLQQAGADMVKLEGGEQVAASVKAISEAGIPVCGHLGLLPQSVKELGGYKVQGREAGAANKMLDDARILEQAGAGMIVLECIPRVLAKQISDEIRVPTIGIGAGVDCDGQVLVTYDLLGLTSGKRPKFSKDYLSEQPVGKGITEAISRFSEDVRQGRFPADEHTFN